MHKLEIVVRAIGRDTSGGMKSQDRSTYSMVGRLIITSFLWTCEVSCAMLWAIDFYNDIKRELQDAIS